MRERVIVRERVRERESEREREGGARRIVGVGADEKYDWTGGARG